MFDENIKFKYPWRPYQAKALDEINKYIKDKKVNVVAAPGSGKTVLGLELARRIGKPVLILSPTITIKNQWIHRFCSDFMDNKKVDWISDDIYKLNFFNSVTYQGLHYAYKKMKKIQNDVDDTDDIVDVEKINTSVDIKTYDLIEEIRKNNIQTIVLDEAHHLKKEWWNSLTKVIQSIKDVVIISLTATPPYDVDYSEWKKYTSLCGEIDVEISVPELVKVKNLCPHQDYIYFSYPTNSEQKMIDEYEKEIILLTNQLKNDLNFINMIKNHPYIKDPSNNIEVILNNPKFYSSMLIFLKAANVDISKDKIKILGHEKNILPLDIKWLEILLQNIIFDNREKFNEDEVLVIEKRLYQIGAIEKKEVVLVNNSKLQKYFLNSISKLDSIVEIVKSEYNNLNEKLRMVILTDYVRKEFLEVENIDINKIGVFPIFLTLLKNNININIAVLTGSIFVIPNNQIDNLIKEINLNGLKSDIVSFIELDYINNYSIVKVQSKFKNKVMTLVSKLFANGDINIIIGTKSLLGEGWDEKSINSLILASFVGSYVLSNQMRGRAIRVNEKPDKTANIWHLVCISDTKLINNSDYDTMKRRFNSFVGIGYNEDIIESGTDRLDIIPKYFSKNNIKDYNSKLINISNRREEMYNKWFTLVDNYHTNTISLNENIEIETNKVKNDFSIIQFSKLLLFVLSNTFIYLFYSFSSNNEIYNVEQLFRLTIVLIFFSIIINIKFVIQCIRAILLSIPTKQLRYVGKTIVKSLCDADVIDVPYEKIRIYVVENKDTAKLNFVIKNVTAHERTIIINCLEEIFAKTESQRYILVNRKYNVSTYHNVPNIFSTNKELANIFYQNWLKYIGHSKLIYTKSIEGRKILLKARKKTFEYINEDEFISSKKKILTDWE